jgi:hypothetical protein
MRIKSNPQVRPDYVKPQTPDIQEKFNFILANGNQETKKSLHSAIDLIYEATLEQVATGENRASREKRAR